MRAQQLLDAEQAAVPIAFANWNMTCDDGYAVQRHATCKRISGGAIAVGQKIGLTSVATRQMFQADEPIHGILFRAMMIHSGATVPISHYIAPRVEVELAFILEHDLRGPNCTISDVLAASAYVVPAIEIIDCRLSAPPRLGNIIADNAGAAGFVLGCQKLNPTEVDLGSIAAVAWRNGRIEGSGITDSIMGHPALAVAWLANDLAQSGQYLHREEIIMAGAFIGPILVDAGNFIKADFHAFGEVSLYFS
jgi:2-oxo-hept-3-ene-1,7-dioate hydratase